MRSFLLFCGVIFLAGCAAKTCRRKDQIPPHPNSEAVFSHQQKELAQTKKNQARQRILVYKYDGSRQCGQGTTVPLEAMAKDLQPISIFSKTKKNDGLVRIQMCGAPTGRANVYEISQKDLPKAKALGFKVWNY